ncbi:MAG: UvrD-helicase domain-containing protein [Acidimicrobiales bacterium]
MPALDRHQQVLADHRRGHALCAAAPGAAAPGAAKTKSLVALVAGLIDDGIAPERILLLSFSRKAAREMGRRLGCELGHELAGRVVVSTFHGLARHILARSDVRRVIEAASYERLDPESARSILRRPKAGPGPCIADSEPARRVRDHRQR